MFTRISQSNRVSGFLAVEIQSSSQATVASLSGEIDGVRVTWTGTAKVMPGDKFDREAGEKLALSRALLAAGAQLHRQAQGRMKCLEDNAEHSRQSRAEKEKEKELLKKAAESPTVSRRRRFSRKSKETAQTL